MGTISTTLAAEVPIRCGARVYSVETETGGARVRYRVGLRERRVFADAVVVAVSGPRAALMCSKLTPEERGYFENTASARGIAVHVLLNEIPRVLPFHRVHLPEVLAFDVARVGLEHVRRDAAPPGCGLLRIELSPSAVSSTWGLDDRRLCAHVLEQLEQTPLGTLRARATLVQRSDHAVPQFGPGALGRLRNFVERRMRTPRIAFAGAHVVGPYTEGSLTSGLRAAAEIVRGLPA
jgi:protoporphyrinogen oxidase